MDRFELLIYSVFGVLCALGITAAIGYKIVVYLSAPELDCRLIGSSE